MMRMRDAGVVPFWPVSSAHCCAAASIWRRLLMQAFACEVARAFTKFGIAIAAKRPMMATTIMISTNVKPALRLFLVCFILFSFSISRPNLAAGGLDDYRFVRLIACRNRDTLCIARQVPMSSYNDN